MAQVCEEQGWSWYDLAGNCRLSLPGVLEVQRSGHRLKRRQRPPRANLGTTEAARVIRALLVPENANLRWTQRTLSEACKPKASIGLVNKLARYLRDEGYLEYLPLPDEGFRLRDPVGLLTAWRESYRFDRHKRLGYFTLMQGQKLQTALSELGEKRQGNVAYAAFSAADFQAPHVRQPKTWLYVSGSDLPLMERLLEAKPVDSGENLVILVPWDEGVFFLAAPGSDKRGLMQSTHPVQTYVDLCHVGGRGTEAAAALLEKSLLPAWNRGGATG